MLYRKSKGSLKWHLSFNVSGTENQLNSAPPPWDSDGRKLLFKSNTV